MKVQDLIKAISVDEALEYDRKWREALENEADMKMWQIVLAVLAQEVKSSRQSRKELMQNG